MNGNAQSPKSFGQILDYTFRLSKRYFKDFFLIVLIFTGPVYLIQALIELASGTSLVTGLSEGGSYLDRLVSSVDETANTSLFQDVLLMLTGLVSIILGPLAAVGIMHGVHHASRGERVDAGDLLRRPLAKLWPIIGSSLLVGVIFFAIVFVPLMIIIFMGVFGAFIEPISAILFSVLMGLGLMLGVALLAARWGFYLGPVAFENNTPGIGRSWHLSKGQTWKIVGIFLILFIITGTITSVIDFVMTLLMGYSVLHTVLTGVVTLVLNVIMYVGYAVVYFDLKVRNDADDLEGMIADYSQTEPTEPPYQQ
ncbi:hypothetical protein JNUCC1_01324 [Lentibacillus sp. JNUCC-1]|uniref:hypothetical protein n=1 Tax=Lentibacillus sp. JNUCC-1 TaxID=2654513 RepID=UPI0012E79FC7|nr:hypothetical protein [Lentibacillus sp. JNUCC-1]MUV37518.1 hypothetical protein [Lentibacillus sp. JNUCC-1]